MLHGNLLHTPDHVVVGEEGPVVINWKASGRGPRLADFAWLMWGAWYNADWIDAAVNAYRRHIELTDEELDRLEAVMYIRPLYLVCFSYRGDLINGQTFDGWSFIDPEYIKTTAAATRAATKAPRQERSVSVSRSAEVRS